jgi:hypothetical protein
MKSRLILASLLSVSALSANATILTFDGIVDLNSYGDNVTGPGANTYQEGQGYTPNISLDFSPVIGWGPYTIWSSGYASLINALGHGSFNVPGEIMFTPSNGASVLFHGFDIATWSSGSYQTDIRIWDDNGSLIAPNLFSFNQMLQPQTVYQPLGQTLQATGVLHLYINNIGSTGIDNVSFSQTVVPVPAAFWLFGSGLLGFLGLSKRKS